MTCAACARIPVLTKHPCQYCGRLNVEAQLAARHLVELAARAESAEARVAELEKLFDDAGHGEHNVLALIDHYQSEAMAESERRRVAEARVKELEVIAERERCAANVLDVVTFCRACNGAGGDGGQAPNGMWEFPCDACYGIGRVGPDLGTARLRIADLESQLAAAREEQALEARVREVLGERFFQVRIARYHEFWQAEWREVVRGETLERFADAETLSALLRAILEEENKS